MIKTVLASVTISNLNLLLILVSLTLVIKIIINYINIINKHIIRDALELFS